MSIYETKEGREQRAEERKRRQFPTYRLQAEAAERAEAARVEQEKAATALKAKTSEAQRQFNAAARELTSRVKAFYSLPLSEMGGYPVEAAPVDYVRPLGREFTVRTSPRNHKDEVKIYWAFRNALATERGTTLTEAGWIRLGSWVSALLENADIQSSADVWEEGLHRLQSLGCFSANGDELFDYAPRPEQVLPPMPEPTPQPDKRSFDERLEAIDSSTRTGAATQKSLVIREIYKDIRSAFYQFAEECRVLFFKEEFTTEEIQAMTRIVEARSLNANTVKGWHTARVLGVRNETVRPLFLTPDEQLSLRYDRGEFDTSTFEGKQKFNREVAKVHGRIPQLS
jgi:hypothetical protein